MPDVKASSTKRPKAFTLVELMIVVAIIGVLASVAIPAFSAYVARAKHSEAPLLLDSLAKAQIEFFQRPRHEADGTEQPKCYLTSIFQPVGGGIGNKVPWLDTFGSFNLLGFQPTGGVYFAYSTSPSGPDPTPSTFDGPWCNHANLSARSISGTFTINAWADLDGNWMGAQYSVWLLMNDQESPIRGPVILTSPEL